jgi:probable lipoprotein NlpC
MCGASVRDHAFPGYALRVLGRLVVSAAIFAACAAPQTGHSLEPALESDDHPVARRVVTLVRPWIGTRYKAGGSTRAGTDCSGFTRALFLEGFGIDLPRRSRDQARIGERVPRNRLEPGDLVFFDLGKRRQGIDHVGVYAGDGLFAHASPQFGVVYDRLDQPSYRRGYRGARRVISRDL